MPTFASGFISTSQILDDAVTAAKIAADAVGSSELADNAVDTAAIAANAVDGTKLALASQAAGDVMYYNGTDWVRLAIGTANQRLSVNAGATAPEYQTLSAGVTASSTDTFTNKTIDANGTGNSITNIENADIAAAAAIVESKLAINTVLMFSSQGNTTSTTEVELATKTFSINDFAANDMIELFIMFNNSTDFDQQPKVRVADGTNTFTSAQFANVGTDGTHRLGRVFLAQRQDSTSGLAFSHHSDTDTASVSAGWKTVGEASMIANWITSAFTLSLRGLAVSPNTTYFKWWVYKRKA